MRKKLIADHKRANQLQTLMLLLGSGAVLGLAGLAFGGVSLMLMLFIAGAVIVWFGPRVSAKAILRLYKAQPLHPSAAPQLFQTLKALSERAELETLPALYYVPSQSMNAFAVSQKEQAVVAVTDGLLRNLAPREVTAVLAHEIAHIRNNDMRVMGMADVLSRLTHSFASIGWIMLLFNLPVIFMGGSGISLRGIVALIVAPQLTALLQLALSRTREYDADLGAVELTGDPAALASALQRLDYHAKGMFESVFAPNRKNAEPSLLRTHPPIEDRIARLQAYAPENSETTQASTHELDLGELFRVLSRPSQPPRRRLFSGLWY